MSTIHVQTPGYENAMIFSTYRLNGQAIRKIKEHYPQGLATNPAAIDTALKAGDYVSVLRPLWAETDRPKRLDWLRANEHKFYPVLPFERAMAEFKANPTVDTIIRISKPLLTFGHLRNTMDAKCSTDLSIEGPSQEMRDSYNTAFGNLVSKELGSIPLISREQHKETVRAVISHLKELEEELSKADSTVPSPAWLEFYGINGFMSAFEMDSESMKPKEDWNSIRLQFVREEIQRAENFLSG